MIQIKTFVCCFLILCLTAGSAASASGAVRGEEAGLSEIVSSLEAYLISRAETSFPGAEGIEWTIIGLFRSGAQVSPQLRRTYLQGLSQRLGESGGVLSAVKYTEYSRSVLALTAMGEDPEQVNGYNLLLPLGDFNAVVRQGINGPIFALLALDSGGYGIPRCDGAAVQTTRELLLNAIITRQLDDGGFALGGASGDPDITSMALMALRPYTEEGRIRSAADRALDFLSGVQEADGGYKSYGVANAESAAQVFTALAALGIDPKTDDRFRKRDGDVLSALLSFCRDDGGFSHLQGEAESNGMASEQALCALAAYQRFLEGKNSLYDMADAGSWGYGDTSGSVFLPGRHPDVTPRSVLYPDKSFADMRGLTEEAAVTDLALRGILNGVSESLFAPARSITRAEFAAVIVRALGLPLKQDLPFIDVPDDVWYHDSVATAYGYGIVTGKTQSLFAPSDCITRQEAAVMLSRAAGLCGYSGVLSQEEIRDLTAQFDDYTASAAWSREGLALCVKIGILPPEEISLRPLAQATRAEIALMVWNLLDAAGLLSA